jgi:uncharacterized repeat protein (TIGR02543 family)
MGGLQSEGGEEKENGEEGGTTEQKEECTVTFDPNDGSPIITKVVKTGSTLYTPYYIPAKPDYLFDCWCLGDRVWKFGSDKVTEDITLSARFKTRDYTVSYLLNGGECDGELPLIYNIETEDHPLPEAYKEGYIFDGWYLDGQRITAIRKEMKRDLTLFAKFYSSVPKIIEQSDTAKADQLIAIEEEGAVTVEISTVEKLPSLFKLRVRVPDTWRYLSVSQGSSRRYVESEMIGNESYATIEMTSDSYNAILNPITYKGDTTMESKFGITLPSGKVIDVNYYPGFVRKAVTFTLDDGLYQHDKKVVDILKPYGFTGTFNINNPATVSDPTIYAGFEVANHNILHAVVMKDAYKEREFVDEYLPSEGADTTKVYLASRTVDGKVVDGMYYVFIGNSWHPMASDETYAKYLEWTTVELEKIFGEDAIVGFAYPHGNQYNDAIIAYLKEKGYLYGRRTGNLKDTTGFALPTDRYTWTYNADHNCLLSVMKSYDEYEDDGELKMFAFGVHAKDFETYDKWGDLERFAELYGNRPQDFWYATNREIFEYEDAVKALVISDEGIINNSKVDVFVTVDGIKTLIGAGETFVFEN